MGIVNNKKKTEDWKNYMKWFIFFWWKFIFFHETLHSENESRLNNEKKCWATFKNSILIKNPSADINIFFVACVSSKTKAFEKKQLLIIYIYAF